RVSRVNSPHRILRPLRQLTVLVGMGCFVLLLYVLYQYYLIQQSPSNEPFTWIQGAQAALAIVGIPVTTYVSLRSLEERNRRNRALKELHNLHGLLNAVDLHQLAKDPPPISSTDSAVFNSRGMTAFEVLRYLDYCSEILSYVGKIAALYAQATDDDVVIS